MKNFKTAKSICRFLPILLFLLVSCGDQDEFSDNENPGSVKGLAYSHKSGLYSQPFRLTLTPDDGHKIYYSTDGSVPSPSKATANGPVFEYKSSIIVQDRSGEPNVLSSYANTEKMYGYVNDPRGFMPTPYFPSNKQVPKATVIRAIAAGSDGSQSDMATLVYFIKNNLDGYQNHPVISLVTDPYNLLDENYGIYVRGPSNRRWDSSPPYNFCMRGDEWEREVSLMIFTGSSRSVTLSTGAGIRIRGGWSRDRGQKSFNVYFRQEYGMNNLQNYPLIPGAVKAGGLPVSVYKGFMLRNGGNDTEYTKFYDALVQSLLTDRNFTVQASIPCVVYINGEYWGPYNLQERYSDNHTEYKYGVDRNNVISYDNGQLDDGDPADEDSLWEMINFRNKDMSIPANYSAFCDLFDIQSFIDYWAAQIYVYNEDWPQNNYRLWRARNVQSGNLYGDGKWRYQMFDTEMALGIYSGGGLNGQASRNAFDKILNGEHKGHFNNQLFKALIKNPDFCSQFVITMMDLYNVNFHPDSCNKKINELSAVYKSLMEGYYERWGKPWGTVFENKTSDAKTYFQNIRSAMVNTYLPNNFGSLTGISSANLRDVTLSAKSGGANVPGASIKINTTAPNLSSGSWTGKYYSALPVTVTANVPSGYQFSGWTVTGGAAVNPSEQTTVINFTGNVTITANYAK